MTIRQGLVFAILLGSVALGCSKASRHNPRRIAPPSRQGKDNDQEKPAPRPPDKEKPIPKVKEKAKEPERPSPPPENPATRITAEAGTVRGEVRWKGAVPAVPSRPDMVVSVRGKLVAVRPAPRVRVDPILGGLANVVVYLKKAPSEAAPFSPQDANLVQRKGRFEPHVQVVALASKLHLRTTDDTADFQLSGVRSFAGGLARGQAKRVSLNRRGLVTVESSDRPWMTPAYLHVLDHDYFAITSGDGKFVLPKLPPGDHEVALWHEGWSRGEGQGPPQPIERRVKVKVGAGQGAEIKWALPAP